MPKTYIHRPSEVEAIQLTTENITHVHEFVGEGNLKIGENSAYVLLNGEGERAVALGDYIIKGVLGVFYPCSEAVFDESYYVKE